MKKSTKLTLRKMIFILGVFLAGLLIGKYDKTTIATASEPVIERPIASNSGEIRREHRPTPRPTDSKRDGGNVLLGGTDREDSRNSSLQVISVRTGDDRKEKLRTVLKKYNSPLQYEVNAFIEVADQYDMDYRIMPAIAFSESTLCKNYPTNTNNCYGWGMPLKTFISQRQAIQFIAEKLNVSSPYYASWRADKSDLYKLGTPYNGADIKFWVEKVEYFMEEVE